MYFLLTYQKQKKRVSMEDTNDQIGKFGGYLV